MSADHYRKKLCSAGWMEGDYPINQRLSIIAEILLAILEELQATRSNVESSDV